MAWETLSVGAEKHGKSTCAETKVYLFNSYLYKPTPSCKKRYNVNPSFCLKVSSDRGPEWPCTACSFRLLIPFLSVPIGGTEKEGETP